MTIIETPVTITTEQLDALIEAEEYPHFECCRLDIFLCGRDYHPELVATDADIAEHKYCQTCAEIAKGMACPPWMPTHDHCPIPIMARQICPHPPNSWGPGFAI